MEEDNHSIGWGLRVHFNRNESLSSGCEIIRLVMESLANVHCYAETSEYLSEATYERQHMMLVKRDKWNRIWR